MEERHNGIVEVVGSIPIGSTILSPFMRKKTKGKRWVSLFAALSLAASCSEKTLEEEAREMLEENASGLPSDGLDASGVTRSQDGLQFTKSEKGTDKQESIGLTKDGAVSYKGEMKNGKPEGSWTTFFPDGKKRWQGVKKDGLNHGPFTMWYPGGEVKMKGTYLNGKKDGLSTMWYEDGTKWREQSHRDGRPTGTWKTWNPEGVLIEELVQSPAPDDELPQN